MSTRSFSRHQRLRSSTKSPLPSAFLMAYSCMLRVLRGCGGIDLGPIAWSEVRRLGMPAGEQRHKPVPVRRPASVPLVTRIDMQGRRVSEDANGHVRLQFLDAGWRRLGHRPA
jgi:hypothetical protein